MTSVGNVVMYHLKQFVVRCDNVKLHSGNNVVLTLNNVLHILNYVVLPILYHVVLHIVTITVTPRSSYRRMSSFELM